MKKEIRKYPIKKCKKCGCEYRYKNFKNKLISQYCIKCKGLINNRIAYLKNPEKYRERSRLNRVKFKEYYKKYNREYARLEKTRLKKKIYNQSKKGKVVMKKSKLKYRYKNGGKEIERKWILNNKEKVKKYKNKYKKSENGLFKAIEYQHRRREWKGKGNGITRKEWLDLCCKFNFKCAICNKDKKLQQDHIIPLSKGGLHEKNNIQPLCAKCNQIKGNNIL